MAVALAASPAPAQPEGAGPRGPWGWQVAGQAAWQPSADLDGGGSLAIGRVFAETGVIRRADRRNSVGVGLGAGRTFYDFSGDIEAPWGDTRDVRLSLPLRAALAPRVDLFAVPTVRFAAEDGADLADGRSAGLIAAVTWRLSERLTVGPGFGAFERLEDDGVNVFPILAIDWRITPRLALSTGGGVGATRGPGLSLSYDVSDALTLGLAVRREDAEFALDDDGPAPGGTGEVRATPIVATAAWSPNPGLRISGFAGVEVGGDISVHDADGRRISRQDYDTVPVIGGQAVLRF